MAQNLRAAENGALETFVADVPESCFGLRIDGRVKRPNLAECRGSLVSFNDLDLRQTMSRIPEQNKQHVNVSNTVI